MFHALSVLILAHLVAKGVTRGIIEDGEAARHRGDADSYRALPKTLPCAAGHGSRAQVWLARAGVRLQDGTESEASLPNPNSPKKNPGERTRPAAITGVLSFEPPAADCPALRARVGVARVLLATVILVFSPPRARREYVQGA